VAGVVLLVGGAVRLIRATPRWWRLLAIPVAIGLLAFVVWPLAFAVAATNVPRTSVGRATPAADGLPYRDVRFAASDGVRLSGWYIPSRNGAAVVLLHGSGSTRSDVLPHAVVLAGHGYGVLLYDARGHGRSAGRAMDFGWYGDRDVAGAVRFLQRQSDVDGARIGVVGMSMGGEDAIGAAAAIPAIRVVVAEGATNRVAGDKAWLSKQFGLSGSITEVVGRMTYGLADLLTAARPPITLHNAVRLAAPRPVLLITAGNVPDELRAAQFIQTGSPSTVQVWTVPATGHTQALKTHLTEWETRVTGFLGRSLSTRP
jgi:pimeloyl-ACP methyl ester carboxylesterase